MNKFFGTDGIRAIAGKYPLVESFVKKLGYVCFNEISKNADTTSIVFIGRDTRQSGEDILKWLFYGLRASGAKKVIDLGIVPTPVVSYLAKEHNALSGIVISASHNPPEFNGIKFFDANGNKISCETEQKIEKSLENTIDYPSPKGMQEIKKDNFTTDYKQFLIDIFTKNFLSVSLNGLKIVMDCANGASYKIAPELFGSLGAEVIAVNCTPNGHNINLDCGSLHTENIQKQVLDNNADCAISFDGDADRVILTDERGKQFDGDDIIAMAAVELKKQNKLKNSKVVLTVMSNAGLIEYLKQNGIDVEIVDVGDKYVTQKLDSLNLSLGGENSGHIIFHDYAPTGDGILAALEILAMFKKSGKPLSYFKDKWTRYPSILKAVTVSKKIPLEKIPGFEEKRASLEEKLGIGGRLFPRYSGTEPKLRILAEGPDGSILSSAVEELINHYKNHSCRLAG